MHKTLATWLCLLFLIPLSGLSAVGKEPVRIAILSSDTSGWGDLLMARLSTNHALSLVERDDLGKALDEVGFKELLGDRKQRSRFGEIAGADFLMLLRLVDNRARLVVCETQLGVTLQDQSVGILDQPQEKITGMLADLAYQTTLSFAGGIKQLVAVPDFVCRDLTFDFAYLQSDYAELLRSAYRQIPGLAVVAIDEAKSIAAERDLSGSGQGRRIVSLFVEGEYRTTRATGTAESTVAITLRTRDSSKVLLERTLPSVPVSRAGRELINLFRRELADSGANGGTNIDEEAQYRMLIERATGFSTIGEFPRSAALREAALLLKPDADDQRIRLVREYTRNNRSPYEAQSWPEGAKHDEGNPLWLAAFQRCVEQWKRSLHHCGYLVLNERISREEATDLAHNAIHSITGVRVSSGKRLTDCEILKKDFIRNVYARIPALDPAPPEVRGKLTGALNTHHFIVSDCMFRCDGNFYQADDLDLLADILLERMPDTIEPTYGMNSFLKTTAMRLVRGDKDVTAFTLKEYEEFLAKLAASGRAIVQVYGRYGKLLLRVQRGEKPAQLLEEMESILATAAAAGFDTREHDYYMDQLKGEVRDLKYAISRQSQPQAPRPLQPRPKPEPVPTSRVSLEPIKLHLVDPGQSEKPDSSGMRWNSRGGWSGINHFVPVADGLDVMWGRGVVLMMKKPGELVPVLSGEKLSIADVAYDGRHLWVAAFYDWGLSVIDRDGRELTRIGREQGLPPCNHYGLVVHPLAPGRMLVSGAFGNENRGWIAVVEFEGRNATVKVIHEATKVWDYKDNEDRWSLDPEKTFSPQLVVEHVVPGPKPRRLIFIIRRRGQPLMVDPETLQVRVYPADLTNRKWFPRSDPPEEAFLSDEGILWVAGSMEDFTSYRFDPQSGLFDAIRNPERWHAGNGTTGAMIRDGDWIYYAGYQWRRLHVRTGKEEMLVENYKALPYHGSGGAWRLQHSKHYGLVAFFEDKGELYRLTITP